MNKLLLFVLIAILGSAGMQKVQATHLMGGDLTYRHLHDSTYELTFLVYRDCNSGQADIDPYIVYWVYYKKNKNIFLNNRRVNLWHNQKNKVEPEAPNCVTPSGICIESGKYIDTVVLGSAPDGYIVTWYRLERNHDIANLKRCVSSTNNSSCTTGSCNTRNPYGMVWTAEIPPAKFKNSSPQFLTVPVPYFCKGITNSFNHVVYDPDGDSLVFKIVTPLSPDNCLPAASFPSSTQAAPSYSDVYQNVTYQSGYSASKPFGSSSSAISINSTTGEMKANPSSSGAYVIAVKIEEYRVDPVTKKTTYLGSIRRDLQFIAGTCPNISNNPPYFTKAGSSTMIVKPYDTLKFDIAAADNTDTIYMKATGSIFGTGSIKAPYASFPATKGYKSVSQQFVWVPTCDHITYTTPHIFTINLADEGCNQVQRTYSIYVKGRDLYTPPNISCIKPLSNSVIKINWDTLKNVAYANGFHVYRVNPDGTRQKIRSFKDSTKLGMSDSTMSNALSKQYRYYLKIENSCGLEGYASDSLSTVVLDYQEVNDKTLKFSWNAYKQGPIKYLLQKKENGTFTTVAGTANLSLTYRSCVLNTDFRIIAVDTSSNPLYCDYTSNTVTSTTVDNTPPTGAPELLNVSITNWNSTKVEFKKSSNTEVTQYGIYRAVNGGSFSSVGTIKTTATQNIYHDKKSLTNNNKHYCYKVLAQDSCGNAGDFSSVHCPVNLKTYAGQRAGKLRWNQYRGYSIDSQFVQRYDTINNKWVTIASLGNGDSSYLDNSDVLCGLSYSYRLKTKEKTTGNIHYSYSDSSVVRAKDTIAAPAIDILYTSNIGDTTTEISFIKSPAGDVKDYLIIALEYNGSSLQNTNITTLSDPKKDTITLPITTKNTATRSYCIGVIAVDSCGQNFSPNAELHCPVFLQGTALNLADRLNWTFYEGFAVDSYYVEVKKNGVWSKLNQLNRSTKTIGYNSLPCNQPYEYRIRTKEKGSKLSVYSNAVTVTPFDTIKPKAPKVNFTTVQSDTAIQLEWQQSSSGDVVKYDIYYALNNGSLSLLKTINKGTAAKETFVHHPITAKNDTFSYRIIAIDSCSVNNRSVNNILQRTVQLKGEGANQENHLWWSAYEGFKVKEYQVETFDKVQADFVQLTTVTPATTSYIHQNLYCFDTIIYRIKAVDANSRFIAYSDTIKLKPFDTISPIPPVVRYVSTTGTNKVEIAWNKSASDDAHKYIIFRRGPKTKFKALDTLLNKLIYTDNVTTDSVYEYALIAIDSCTENESYYKSNPAPLIIMQSQTVGCNGKLLLSWNAYNAFEKGLNRYELYRSVDGKPEKLLGNLSNTTLSFTDNVSQYHNYTYRVKAVENNGGDVAYSPVFAPSIYQTHPPRIYTASITETDVSNGEVSLYWQKQQGERFVAYSQLYYRADNQANYSLLKDKISLTDSTFTQTGLNTKSLTHHYFLVNIDSCGTTSDTLSIHKTMDMSFGYGQLQHNLSWTNYEGFGVQRYILQQLIGGVFTDVDTISAAKNTFTRFPAPCNTVITYRIAAEDNLAHQAYSDTTSGVAIDLQATDKPTIRNITVIDNQYIKLDFTGVDSMDTYGFAIQKSKNGLAYLTDGIVLFAYKKQNSTYLDTVNLATNYFSYKVVALDSCLNANPSDNFKPVHLTGTPGNFENHLVWRPFVGYAIDSYQVEYNNNGNWMRAGAVAGGDTTFTHQNVGCNQQVNYRITATEKSGIRSTTSNWVSLTPFDTITPPAPDFYAASVVNSKTLELRWNYDKNSDVKYYRVYEVDGSGNRTFLDTVIRQSTYRTAVGNARDSIYTYAIEAIDSCNASHISPFSGDASNFIFNYKRDTCDPTTYLNWTEPKGLQNAVDMYFINRSIDGKPWKVIDTVMSPFVTYADSNVQSNEHYAYRITAYNSNIKQRSETDTQAFRQHIRPLPGAPMMVNATVTKTGETNGEVMLTWNKVDRTEEKYFTGYNLYWRDTLNKAYTLIAQQSNRNDTTFAYTTNTTNKYGYYRLTVTNTCGSDGDTSMLHAPIQLQVENLNLQSDLSWSQYYGFNVSNYNIYSNVAGAGFTKIGTVPGTQFHFKDSTVGCGESIDFYVEAVSPFGISSQSDIENVIGFDTTLPKATTIQYVTFKNKNQIELNWNASASKDAKYYTISYKAYNDNVWDTLVENVTGLSYTDNTLGAPVRNTWEFRITVTDSCGNAQPKPSPVHRPVALDALRNGSQIDLTWMNYRGWNVKDFEIYRDNNLIKTLKVGKTRSDSIFNFQDTNIGCDTTIYEYYINAISKDLSYSSTSNSDTAMGIDRGRPDPVYLSSASVLSHNLGVRLKWNKSLNYDARTYNIMRKKFNETDYSLVKKSEVANTSDVDSTNLDNFSNYCYQIAVEDNCDNIGPASNEACILSLYGGNLKGANSIKWNEYVNWQDSVDHYEIYRSTDSSGFEFVANIDSRFTAFVDTGLNDSFMTYCYRVKAMEQKGGENAVAWSTTICITQEPLIYIPTAFTPDMSKGLNDAFGPKGAFIPNIYTMRIYNRWGQVLYETNRGVPWDGRTVNQEFVPLGVYLYYIELTTTNGETYTKTGSVMVLR
ncbi:hypothetical protein GC194_01560 [bacterium]|nr:hypothetical protein [bacterium]